MCAAIARSAAERAMAAHIAYLVEALQETDG
jgi:hypothetical protein